MALPVRTRRGEGDRWEPYREIIKGLYLDEDKVLDDVRAIMDEKYGFVATEHAYKKRLSRWRMSKNIPAPVMEYMVGIAIARQQQDGKATQFFWHDRPVDGDKLERFRQKMPRESDRGRSTVAPSASEFELCPKEWTLLTSVDLAQLRNVRCETPSSSIHETRHNRERSEDNLFAAVPERSGQQESLESIPPIPTIPFEHQRASLPANFMFPSWDSHTPEPRLTPTTNLDPDYQELRTMLQSYHPSFFHNDNHPPAAYHSSDSINRLGTLPAHTGSSSMGLRIADILHSRISENLETMDEALPELERLLAGYCFIFGPTSRTYSRQALQYCYHRSFDDAQGEYLPLFRRVLHNHFLAEWPLEQPRRAAFTVDNYLCHGRLNFEETESLLQGISLHIPPNQVWWKNCDDWLDITSIFHSHGLFTQAEPFLRLVLGTAKNELATDVTGFFRAPPRCTSEIFKAISTHADNYRGSHMLSPKSPFPSPYNFLQDLQALRFAFSTQISPTRFDYFQMKCWVGLAKDFCTCTRSLDIPMDMFRALHLGERTDIPAGPNGTEFFGLYTVFQELWTALLSGGVPAVVGSESISGGGSEGQAVGGRGTNMEGWRLEAKEVVITVVNAFGRWLPEDNWSVRESRGVLQGTFGGPGSESQGDIATDAAWHAAQSMMDWDGNAQGSMGWT